MFNSIIESGSLTIMSAAICTGCALLLGFIIAKVYMFSGTYSKNFVTTLVILPAMVEIVIIMVNGNLGTGVAVMGAFSLVRFRSLPGSSREISSLFFAMATGLACGMGYVSFAAAITIVLCVVILLMHVLHFGEKDAKEQELKISIPENLDYTEIFDEIFVKNLDSFELLQVKTANLGSMFELKYTVKLKSSINPKAFMDELRCRNGNLPITLCRAIASKEEL